MWAASAAALLTFAAEHSLGRLQARPRAAFVALAAYCGPKQADGRPGLFMRLLMPQITAARVVEADGYVTSQPLDASEPEHLWYAFELAGADCTAIITNTPHNTAEACAIVRNLIALVEGQRVEFVAALFRAIWGAEPGRLPYLNRPSFFGEILCCWRPRWIPGTKKSPMHAYAGTSGGRSHGAAHL